MPVRGATTVNQRFLIKLLIVALSLIRRTLPQGVVSIAYFRNPRN